MVSERQSTPLEPLGSAEFSVSGYVIIWKSTAPQRLFLRNSKNP